MGIPYRLHRVAPFEGAALAPAHGQPVLPAALLVAVGDGHLLQDAVLDGGAAGGGFAVLVGVEDVLEFLLVGLRGCFDGGEGAVGAPEVGVAAVGVEGFGGDGGRGRGGGGGG